MAYDFDKKKEREEKNSLGGAGGRSSADPQLPNSLIMRIMEDPAAEQEADRLSSGVRANTPNTLMREMGGRLGADFSSVRFHSDSDSLSKSRMMGARAWAQGRDVYFGRGGFEPSVAAHELVHTVQQGAVKGDVSRSMPMGAVQLLPDEDDDKKFKKEDAEKQNEQQEQDQQNNDTSEILAIEQGLMKYFVTEDGQKLYSDFEGKLKSLLNKKFKKKEILYSAEASVRFLVRACYRDYALRDILQEVVSGSVESKNDRKDRAREYKALIKTLSSRITPADAEQLAIEVGMFGGKPKFGRMKKRKSTRAYDIQADNNGLVSFNPNHIPELSKVQNAIDQAQTPAQAYSIFAAYTGNSDGKFVDKYKSLKVDMNLFRGKLKHMARVVTDYPELKHNIGNMNVIDPKSNVLMSTTGSRGGKRNVEFEYNKRADQAGIQGDLDRAARNESNEKDNFHISPVQYHGTHELGHGLASMLVENTGEREALYRNTKAHERIVKRSKGEKFPVYGGNPQGMSNQIAEEVYALPENDMLESVLAKDHYKMMSRYGINSVNTYVKNSATHLKEQVSTKNFADIGMTSVYGSQNASEMFAEAVADVYSHGSGAKDMSKELVKEYESRGKKKVRDKFNKYAKNKKPWWIKLLGFFA